MGLRYYQLSSSNRSCPDLTTHTWSTANRLLKVQQSSAGAFDLTSSYRPDGLRHQRADSSGTTEVIRDGEEPLARVDTAGNVYTGGSGGIYILDPQGKKLGRIAHGLPSTSNIGFGGDDWKTLYFTSRDMLGAVNVKIAGVPVPVPRKQG